MSNITGMSHGSSASVSPPSVSLPSVWPPSADMISAIVRYADLRKDLGEGKTLLRLSAPRLAEAAVLEALGDQVIRAGEIGVVWSERDEQIVRVVDDSLVKHSLATWWEDYFDRYDQADPCAVAA